MAKPMNRTLIEWCDYTWNPIVGCKNPHLHGERLGQPQRVKIPRIVFAGSMGDMFDPDFDPAWRHQVWGAMNAAPRHHYVLLTKRPDLIDDCEIRGECQTIVDAGCHGHLWLGVSVTCDDDWWRVERLMEVREATGVLTLVSFEPLLGRIEHDIPSQIQWVIIGAQTGPGAVAPEATWVRRIWLRARPWTPVFEKDNLATVMPHELPQRWPEAMVAETEGVAAR